MYGISDNMMYFCPKSRQNKGMKILCRGADLPLHGYIPMLAQNLWDRVQNMIKSYKITFDKNYGTD